MTEDIVDGSDLLVGVREEQAHHAQQDHSGGVHLQRGHLTDKNFVSVFMRRVAAPGTDEDVGVADLEVEILRDPAAVDGLLEEVSAGAQEEHLSLQICGL